MQKRVRSGVAMGAPELVRELGGDFLSLASSAGLEPAALKIPDTPIHASAFIRFLEIASERLRCEAFGLRLAQYQGLSLFGSLGSLFQSCTTIGELVGDLAHYFPLHTQGTLIAITPAPGGIMVNYEMSSGVGNSNRQVVELGFGILAKELRRHLPDWRPAEIYLRHAAPADRKWHHLFLGPELIFNADRNAIFIDQSTLSRPTTTGDLTAHQTLAHDYDKARKSVDGMVQTRTESIVRAILPFAPCDLSSVAKLMRMSPRTLQRRLALEETNFAEIVDSVRADLALKYLEDSMLSVAEIAEILQFSETGALSRAFRRWHGKSPREVLRTRMHPLAAKIGVESQLIENGIAHI